MRSEAISDSDPRRLAIAIAIRGDCDFEAPRPLRSEVTSDFDAVAIRGHWNPRPLESEAMGIQSAPIRIRFDSDWALQEMERCSFALDAMEEAHRRAVMDATEAWNQVANEREAKEVLLEEVE